MNQRPPCERSNNDAVVGRRTRAVDFRSEKSTPNLNSVSAFSVYTPGYKDYPGSQKCVPNPRNCSQSTVKGPVRMNNPQDEFSKLNREMPCSLSNSPCRPTPIYMPASRSSRTSPPGISMIDATQFSTVEAEPDKPTKPICCDKCHAFFNSFTAIDAHNKTLHKYLTTCEVCYKGFKTTSNLERHNRMHEGKRDFKCIRCDREFSRKDHLTSHILTHPTKCPVCSLEFKERTSLASHCGVKHRLEVKFCNYCNEALSNDIEYEKHRQSHTGSSTSSSRNKPRHNNDSEETGEVAPVEEHTSESMYNVKNTCKAKAAKISPRTNSREIKSKTKDRGATAIVDSNAVCNTRRAIITDDVFRSVENRQNEVKKYSEQKDQAFKDLSVVHGQDNTIAICSDESKLANKEYGLPGERHSDLNKNLSGMSSHRVDLSDDIRHTVNNAKAEKICENHDKRKLKQNHPKTMLTKDTTGSVCTFSCVSKANYKPSCRKSDKPRSFTEQVIRASEAIISNPVISALGINMENKHASRLVNRKAEELPVNRLDLATGILGMPPTFKIEVGPHNPAIYPRSSYCEPPQSNRLYNMATHMAPYYTHRQGNRETISGGRTMLANNVHGLDHAHESFSRRERDQQARWCRICNCLFPSDQLYAVHYLAYHCSCHV